MKRQPGFARALLATLATGEPVNVFAHVGRNAWQRASCGHHGQQIVVALDPDTEPDDFDYRCVSGLVVTLNGTDCDVVLARRVAVRMCDDGAALVVLLHPALPQFCEYFPGTP